MLLNSNCLLNTVPIQSKWGDSALNFERLKWIISFLGPVAEERGGWGGGGSQINMTGMIRR